MLTALRHPIHYGMLIGVVWADTGMRPRRGEIVAALRTLTLGGLVRRVRPGVYQTTHEGPVPSCSVKKVLFVCTGNSARSQMAEGLLRQHAGDRFQVFSAGTQPGSLHPLAVRAMADFGIDVSSQVSKSVYRFRAEKFDYVITVCDRASETTPVFPRAVQQLHWSFSDPAAIQGSEHERLDAFLRVRDEMAAHIAQFASEQASEKSGGGR